MTEGIRNPSGRAPQGCARTQFPQLLQPPHPVPWVQPAGQLTVPQLDAVQFEVQPHELAQSTSPHAPAPMQVTEHAFVSQPTSLHALLPLHVTLHVGSPDPLQSMLSHALFPVQVIVQLRADEQSMSSHAFGELHAIVQS
jgi:hypothetical protein